MQKKGWNRKKRSWLCSEDLGSSRLTRYGGYSVVLNVRKKRGISFRRMHGIVEGLLGADWIWLINSFKCTGMKLATNLLKQLPVNRLYDCHMTLFSFLLNILHCITLHFTCASFSVLPKFYGRFTCVSVHYIAVTQCMQYTYMYIILWNSTESIVEVTDEMSLCCNLLLSYLQPNGKSFALL